MKRSIPIVAQSRAADAASAKPGNRLSAPPPLSLYVHVPWCVKKCPYCDFNSHEATGEIPEQAYAQALIADLESALPLIWGRRVDSIFIGGGTPSLLSPAVLDQLLVDLRMRLPLAADAEITLEANPGTVDAARFAAIRDAGVTRLSLGVQSFDDRHLKALGRIHGRDEALRAAETAVRLFPTCNFDLMYGLPEQTLAEALADIDTALGFAPPHLSCYQLTLEPNTRFAAEPPPVPEADTLADMQDAIEAKLAAAGYANYETSAFARPGERCRHNLNYWNFGDYLGIGAGAHSKLTLVDHAGVRFLRQMRWKLPKQYLAHAGTPVQEEHAIDNDDLPFEFMMNSLRLADGFAIALFEERTGLPWQRVEAIVAGLEREGLLARDSGFIRPTARGRRFLNVMLQHFLAG